MSEQDEKKLKEEKKRLRMEKMKKKNTEQIAEEKKIQEARAIEENFILGTLLDVKEIKDLIVTLNKETNSAEIQKIYNTENDKNDEALARLKELVTKHPDSIVKERRSAVITMRTVAIKKGLTMDAIQEKVVQLNENECFEIFYYCCLFYKYTLYVKEKDKKSETEQGAKDSEDQINSNTSQEFKMRLWQDFKTNFFYDNIPSLQHLEYEMEGNDEEVVKKEVKKEVKKVVYLDADAVKFKPIVWEPEVDIDIADLKENMNENKVRLFDDRKEPLVMIFIGHVDNGKSTICGSILQLSGTVNELEVMKLKEEAKNIGMESWYNAHVMDVIDEEKETGKTIEMGRAFFETRQKRFTILDCPGHKNFVQAMIDGASQADVASLVVSAKPGEFESGFVKEGQTREHAMLARALGARYVIVIVNKMDTVNWSQERYDYIKAGIEPFLKVNCGFDPSKIFWTILSGLHQVNMAERISSKLAPWYQGKSLFETFDDLPQIKRSQNKILRIPLLDKFKDMGAIITSCKINSGIVKPNMNCILMPIQKPITISKVMDTNDCDLGYANTGESVTLHLKGLNEDEIRRGYVICGLQYWTNICNEFESELQIFELLEKQCFGPGFTCLIHLHTALEEVVVTHITRLEEVDGVIKKTPVAALKSGQKGIVKFKSKNLLCLEKFDDFDDLGRFALRKEIITIGAGKILRFKPVNPELLKNNNFFTRNQGTKVETKEVAKEEVKEVVKVEVKQPIKNEVVDDFGEDI